MKQLWQCFGILSIVLLSCNSAPTNNTTSANPADNTNKKPATASKATRHFRGAFSNGMKGDSISFDVSADGTKLENLTFKGYWRCAGKLESTIAGPDAAFTIKDGKVNDHILEPPGGGSTAWRFDLEANIDGARAEGNFRMNISNLDCNSYKLNWTAVADEIE